MRYSSYRISSLSLPIRRAVVRRLETAPPRPKSGGGIPRRDPRECTSPRRKILFYPPSPRSYLSFLLTLLLLSSRREFIGTTRDDVKLPFRARKRISHIISALRAAFSTLFSDLRRHVDLIVAIIYERQFGTRPPKRRRAREAVSTNPGFYHIA